MHEIPLVKSIFETVESEFRGKLQRVSGIHISAWLLNSIQPLLMQSACGVVSEDKTRNRNTSLHLEVLPVIIYYKDCDKMTEVVDCTVGFAGGDDKARKYPRMFLTSELMLVSKPDLLPCLPFSVEAVMQGGRYINARHDAVTISRLKGEGPDKWINWLTRKVKEKKSKLPVNNEVEN
jgi:Zn finger protein HypA/HybF involved in hydrogenase expression